MIVNLTCNQACISLYLNISIVPTTLAYQRVCAFIENNNKCHLII